jgi:starch phosphorylase
MSIIEEGTPKHIRMAHLAIVGSHSVNGVAALHTRLMKETIFADFDRFYPEKINNKTNGVTPRRWLHHANPDLSDLISTSIDKDWARNLDELEKLTTFADDPAFRRRFREIKQNNKLRLAELIKKHMRIDVNCDSIFDVHIKRIHEYKRQLLNILHVITLYNRFRVNGSEMTPRTVIFAGKAAPGYVIAKLIIKLINDVADIVNNDPHVGNRLKVLFVPNYDVSTASDIIPAADLSEQISTAGLEASGTGNMKLALNGALTIGTLDGANIEIRDEVGEDNIFIFGNTAEEIEQIRREGYYPREIYAANAELKQVIDMIGSGFFSPDEPKRFEAIVNMLLDGSDRFFVLADYENYVRCQEQVATVYLDEEEWTRRAILNVAKMGKFSSDRTIREYANDIWNINPVNIVMPKNREL